MYVGYDSKGRVLLTLFYNYTILSNDIKYHRVGYKMLEELLSLIYNPFTLGIVGLAAIICFVTDKKAKKKSKSNSYITFYQPSIPNQSTMYYPNPVQYQTITTCGFVDPYYSEKSIKGRYGEYSSYMQLRGFEQIGARFVANVYVPKNGTETTEIDLVMICQQGLIVIESKNFSGWIFGDENRTNWVQTLPVGKGKSHKEFFYNPIMQNRNHIKYLSNYLCGSFPIYSVIVFSDMCTLKSVSVTSDDVIVVNQSNLFSAINWICNSTGPVLTQEDIIRVYNKLYPLTQVNMLVKQQHIVNVQNQIKTTSQPSNTNTGTGTGCIYYQ